MNLLLLACGGGSGLSSTGPVESLIIGILLLVVLGAPFIIGGLLICGIVAIGIKLASTATTPTPAERPPPPPPPPHVSRSEPEPVVPPKSGASVPLVLTGAAMLMLGVVGIAVPLVLPAAFAIGIVFIALAIASESRRRVTREPEVEDEPDRIVLKRAR